MTADQHLQELNGITQRYASGARHFTAIENVHLVLNEGEFVALLGPSGCGKSTLLRIITGLQQPTEGQVLYHGRPLDGVNPRATIVFQTFALFPWLTVRQNVEVALKARGTPAAARAERAEELLDRVGLAGFDTAYPRELSGGMRQKAGFARAMAVEPELLCLDEPFSALDVLSAASLRGELLELWTGGDIPTKAILMVTHNIEDAVFMADRLVVMEKEPGRVVAELKVGLPHPRHRKSSEFLDVVDMVYGMLAGGAGPEVKEADTAPRQPGLAHALPHIAISDLIGILEHFHEASSDTESIYRLAEDLRLDSDRILRLTKAAAMLGFATVKEGDITITPSGRAFAEADIGARKEIFATGVRRLPLFRWVIGMLSAAKNHQMEWDVLLAALRLEFPAEMAEGQMDIIAGWGRYAEVLLLDDRAAAVRLAPTVG